LYVSPDFRRGGGSDQDEDFYASNLAVTTRKRQSVPGLIRVEDRKKFAKTAKKLETEMLIIEGWLKLATGEFDKVADAARTMVAETVKEEGCLTYAFSRDINDPDLIRIAERWETAEALAAHGQSAHMAAFNKAMGGVKREGAELWLYSGEAIRRIM
jgi:quinol monooxygenase YgiN